MCVFVSPKPDGHLGHHLLFNPVSCDEFGSSKCRRDNLYPEMDINSWLFGLQCSCCYPDFHQWAAEAPGYPAGQAPLGRCTWNFGTNTERMYLPLMSNSALRMDLASGEGRLGAIAQDRILQIMRNGSKKRRGTRMGIGLPWKSLPSVPEPFGTLPL